MLTAEARNFQPELILLDSLGKRPPSSLLVDQAFAYLQSSWNHLYPSLEFPASLLHYHQYEAVVQVS